MTIGTVLDVRSKTKAAKKRKNGDESLKRDGVGVKRKWDFNSA